MTLDKAIAHKKEHRKPYQKKAQRNSESCRNHGSCGWCERNRLIQTRRMKARVEAELKECPDDTTRS